MNNLSFTQKLMRWISSKEMFETMERESKTWMVQCSNCKHEKSIWDIGGIRSGASGKPVLYIKCSNCGEKNWHQVKKSNSPHLP